MKKKLKAILSFVLVLAMTLSTWNGIGMLQKAAEVQAEELTKISWEDFGATYNTTYNTERTFVYSGSLNNTAFEGDISMPAGGGFRYATANGWFGMNIQVNADGQLVVGTTTMNMNGVGPTAENKYDAATFKLETFINTRFTLKIEMREVTETSAKATVYVNGTAVADAFTLTSWDNGSNDAFKIAPKLSFAVNGCGTEATIYAKSEGTTTPDPEPTPNPGPTLAKLTWEDLGFGYDSTYNGKEAFWENTKYLSNREDFGDTEFVGDLVFADNSVIRYAAKNHTIGIDIGVENGDFVVKSGTINVPATTIPAADASKYGLDSFVGTQMTLKIQMTEYTGTAGVLSVYINDVAVLEEGNVSQMSNDWTLGKGVCLCINTGSITTKKEKVENPEPTPKPELTNVTFEDFGFVKGTTYHGSPSPWENNKVYDKSESMNNTKLSGKILFTAGSELRYGASQWNHGVRVKVDADGNLIADAVGVTTAATTIPAADASKYGLKSFANEAFTLAIARTNQTATTETFTITINDVDVAVVAINTVNSGYVIGNNLCISAEGGDVTLPDLEKKTLPDVYHDLTGGAYSFSYTLTKLEKRTAAGDHWEEIASTDVNSLSEAGDYRMTYSDDVAIYTQEVVTYTFGEVDLKEYMRATKIVKEQAKKEDYCKNKVRLCDIDFNDLIERSDVSSIADMLLGRYEKN